MARRTHSPMDPATQTKLVSWIEDMSTNVEFELRIRHRNGLWKVRGDENESLPTHVTVYGQGRSLKEAMDNAFKQY